MTKIYFETHGCSTNQSESEIMMGLLKKADFSLVEGPEDADLLIINICTVKGEETALKIIRKLHESYPIKKIIIAGCITKFLINDSRKLNEELSFINTHNIKSIVEVVEEVLHGNIVTATGTDEYKKINLPKLRKNPIISIIPILNGCAGYCSYCSVKYVKGKLFSYSMQDIEQEVKESLAQGCKEIWITSQDNAAYMLEKEKVSKLPELINNIAAIEGDFFIRIGMMNPTHLMHILDSMIAVYKHPKVFKFLHVPIQSGNNKILELMKRNYTVEDWKEIIRRFREEIPDITISTDIIVGFPKETEEQFLDSVNLVREIKPEVVNISRFQGRPWTDAAKMAGQINGNIAKERSRLLTDVFATMAKVTNERWLSSEVEIIIDEIGKDNSWVGRNITYRPVIVRGNLKLGDIIKVKLDKVTPYDLRGEIICKRLSRKSSNV